MAPANVRHFAAEAPVLNAAELEDIATPKRYTLLLCLIHRAQIQARDDLAEVFLKRIARFHVQAQHELVLIRASCASGLIPSAPYAIQVRSRRLLAHIPFVARSLEQVEQALNLELSAYAEAFLSRC